MSAGSKTWLVSHGGPPVKGTKSNREILSICDTHREAIERLVAFGEPFAHAKDWPTALVTRFEDFDAIRTSSRTLVVVMYAGTWKDGGWVAEPSIPKATVVEDVRKAPAA